MKNALNMNDCSQSVTLDLQMQTGSSPDQLWSCWQIRTEEPISLNPGLHWYTTVSL